MTLGHPLGVESASAAKGRLGGSSAGGASGAASANGKGESPEIGGEGMGSISRESFRRRLQRRGCWSLGKHRACPSIGKQVNHDLDASILVIEEKGTQPILVGERGDHALAVRAEVHVGDIRPKMTWNLLKCGVQAAVEHDCQGFPLYSCAIGHGPRPIEHHASKIVMRPSTRYNRHDFRATAVENRYRRGCSGVRLLAVAWAAAGNEYAGNEQPKHEPTC